MNLAQLQRESRTWPEPYKSHAYLLMLDAESDCVHYPEVAGSVLVDLYHALLATKEAMVEGEEP